MHAYHDDIKFAGRKVTVKVNGVEVERVTEVMTGKKGFVTFYEWPLRVIGDCLMMRQAYGNVTCVIE